MYLIDFLKRNDISIEQFSKIIKYNPHYVARAIRGKRVGSKFREYIVEFTKGTVSADEIHKPKKIIAETLPPTAEGQELKKRFLS